MLKSRVSSAREHLERLGLEALVFFGLPGIRYLTGFTGSDGVLVLSLEEACFLTDSRYTEQAAQETSGVMVREYRGKSEGVAELVREWKVTRIGIEAEHATVALYQALGNALAGVALIPVGAELDDLRRVKDCKEVKLIAECADLASSAFLAILDEIQPGAVERDIALSLELAMKKAGADDKSFDFIVASGTRGALPHGKASTKTISDGELVTVDFGAVLQGYCSDETVTVAVGEPNARQREVYQVVKEAHDRALDAIRPGVSLKHLDSLARTFIEKKGFGKYFGHGLGHGVGLEVHEKPVVSYKSEGLVEEGMVFTVEPGIYIPNWGGVRIEDTVMVTGDGCQILTKVSKELMVL